MVDNRHTQANALLHACVYKNITRHACSVLGRKCAHTHVHARARAHIHTHTHTHTHTACCSHMAKLGMFHISTKQCMTWDLATPQVMHYGIDSVHVVTLC